MSKRARGSNPLKSPNPILHLSGAVTSDDDDDTSNAVDIVAATAEDTGYTPPAH